MYYIRIDAENPNELVYYCRNCQYKDEMVSQEGVCVLNMNLKKGEQEFQHIVNKYTKLDPTLPRIYNMRCPHVECVTNTSSDVPVEIIYLRYDDNNLKYLYICTNCDTTWKTDEKN
jgi:DNA-directed RNA polymerase subunit M/transcription elongation factor TFIIS